MILLLLLSGVEVPEERLGYMVLVPVLTTRGFLALKSPTLDCRCLLKDSPLFLTCERNEELRELGREN